MVRGGLDRCRDRFNRLCRIGLLALAGAALLTLAEDGTARAGAGPTVKLDNGTERTTYAIGPINVTSGQNRIAFKPVTGTEKPAVDGWITRIEPNMVRADGSIPRSSKVMFHHGVWINQSASSRDRLFYATGEEKTIVDLPPGYGYHYKASDVWILNHMLHNLEPEPEQLFVTYTIDFIPDSSPAAAAITPVRPIWMDVQQGIYPVFDVHRGSGGADGEFTYPEDAENPYPGGHQLNEKTIPEDGVLVSTAGHVHSGGLSTDLYLKRDGAGYAGPNCETPRNLKPRITKLKRKSARMGKKLRKMRKRLRAVKRKQRKLRSSARASAVRKLKRRKRSNLRSQKKVKRNKRITTKKLERLKTKNETAQRAYRTCTATQPRVEGNRAHLFESKVKYFEPRGPVSWDMAMHNTDDDWRVAVKAGDTLELQATYETKRASWYESMGINVVYWAKKPGGKDPYETRVDQPGELNHGQLAENYNHGGDDPVVGPDPTKLPDGISSGGPFKIGGFTYGAGNFRIPGSAGRPPVVKQGQSFTFKLTSGDQSKEIWHSLTSCKSPCNKSTGIAYPIPDGEFQFDSGQLGLGGEPTVNRDTWTTPKNLPVGTHTFFCRIHPMMRGAFRVVKD